jgi:enamine deaminase RidA (YjgF/YER057c/UK114 family)
MSTTRQRVSSGAPWEESVGYCRAVRAGTQIAVSGTTAIGDDGKLVGLGDPYQQTLRCLTIIEAALRDCGAELSDVIRTRIYVVRAEDWKDIGRAHAEVFGHCRPASTLVEVSRLIDPEMLVEIEADAVLDQPPQ